MPTTGSDFNPTDTSRTNAAAKHFTDSKIVIIGLHDGSGTLEGVADFAKKRGLVFPIAIDKPDPMGQSFGATFAAFGMSAIPTCAVIDGAGRVAYLGQFQQGIEVANNLAGNN
jgi:peroxiredoxin